MKTLQIETEPDRSWMENRNGMPDIRALRVVVYSNFDVIYIEGVNRRGQTLRGGMRLTKEAFLDLCREGLKLFGDTPG